MAYRPSSPPSSSEATTAIKDGHKAAHPSVLRYFVADMALTGTPNEDKVADAAWSPVLNCLWNI